MLEHFSAMCSLHALCMVQHYCTLRTRNGSTRSLCAHQPSRLLTRAPGALVAVLYVTAWFPLHLLYVQLCVCTSHGLCGGSCWQACVVLQQL